MSGKRGRSGPPANLNAVRNPWEVFWRRRALRPGDRWCLRIVAEHSAALKADKPNATGAELRLIEIAATARGCAALILASARGERDILGFDTLCRFLSLERQTLKDLGLQRRAKPVPALETYLAQKAKGEFLPDDKQPIVYPEEPLVYPGEEEPLVYSGKGGE